MPQFLMCMDNGVWWDFRPAENARQARRIAAGWKGRHPDATITVFSINGTTDVTAEILPQKEA